MGKSQGGSPAKESLKPRHRIWPIMALGLALAAAGLLALRPANLGADDPVVNGASSICSSNYYAVTDGTSACDSAAAPTNSLQAADVSAIAVIRLELTDARQSSRARRSRAWNGDRSGPDALRPGYTMVELCSSDADHQAPRCRTGGHNETPRRIEGGATPGTVAGYSISGHVMTVEGAGLSGVTVVASAERLKGEQLSDSRGLRFWTMTDALGAYSLEGVPDGEYTIRSGSQGPYRSARISVRAGVDYADILVTRDLETVAEGRVFAATGEPLEGVMVLPVLLGQPSVLTDENGHFRLPITLKSTINSFTLRFQRPGFREQTGIVEVPQNGGWDNPVANVVMHPVESWTSVNGTVRGDSGEPLAGRAVELRPRSGRQSYKTITDREGQYEFAFVESPADYRLIVFGGVDHKDYEQTVYVTVDMEELDIVAESYEFGEVTGQLVNLNGVPVPDFELVLRNTGSRLPNTMVSTDKLGNFEVTTAPAGEFVVASQSAPSILVQGLHLRPGDKLYLPLVLDWGEHQIRGVVLDAHDNPVPASRVVLQWSHQEEGVTTSATRRTASDAQGYFMFSDLGPGPHALQIDAPGFSPVDIDHDLSRQGYDLTVRLN